MEIGVDSNPPDEASTEEKPEACSNDVVMDTQEDVSHQQTSDSSATPIAQSPVTEQEPQNVVQSSSSESSSPATQEMIAMETDENLASQSESAVEGSASR